MKRVPEVWLAILLLILIEALSGRACASETDGVKRPCDIYDIVTRAASSVLRDTDHELKNRLSSYYFKEFDPLYRFELDERDVRLAVSYVDKQLSVCTNVTSESVANMYRSMFKDWDWAQRTLILAMSQLSRNEHIDIVEAYIGFMISQLNQGVVPPHAPQSCRARGGYSAALYFSDGVTDWFRTRVIGWLECADGRVMTYLPEIGWRVADARQIEAIRKSSP